MTSERWITRVGMPSVLALALFAWWAVDVAVERIDGTEWSSWALLLFNPFTWAALLLFGGVAISWVAPRFALAAGYAAFLVQLAGITFLPLVFWPQCAAIVVTSALVAVRVQEARRATLLALLPLGVLIGVLTDVRGVASIWIGAQADVAQAVFVPLVVRSALGMAGILATWTISSALSAHQRRLVAAAEADIRAARAELADSRIELRVAEERDRIAQDVHDITAHSLSVIVAQADGGAAQAGDEISRTALATIAGSARTALAEVRTLLENIEDPRNDTGFTAADIEGLVDGVRTSGRTVELALHGVPMVLPAATGLAAYRIAQEALTNAVLHGAEKSIEVALDWQPSGLSIVVSSRLRPEPGQEARPGRGVIGMEQRARLVGGWVSSGPDQGAGRYVVTAFLPARSVMAS